MSTAIRPPVRPNFLLGGCPRCGTTSLYYYLMGHPDVFLSAVKEPGFLTYPFLAPSPRGPGDRATKKRIVTSCEDYRALFEKGAGKRIVGEGTVNVYRYGEQALPRIREFLGDPFIVFLLRNPVDRALSSYMLKRRENRETLSFEESLEAEPQRVREQWHHAWYYVDSGLYARRMEFFMKNFTHVKICLFDQLAADPVALVQEVCRFLGVDDSYTPSTETRHNAGGIPRWSAANSLFSKKNLLQRIVRSCGTALLGEQRYASVRDRLRSPLLQRVEMKPETREALKKRFRNDILALQSLTGLDLSGWL